MSGDKGKPCLTSESLLLIPSCRHILQFKFHYTARHRFSQSVLLTYHALHNISLLQTVSSCLLDHMLSSYPEMPQIFPPSSLSPSQLTSMAYTGYLLYASLF